MDRHNLETNPIRFKFMPTPGSKLHVGHAWLVFVMHSLVKAIRREGRAAELVLVLDEINMTPNGSFDDKVTKPHGEQILHDMKRLEMGPDRVIWNGDRLFVNRANDPALSMIALETWNQSCVRPVSYFLHNALLDAHMGITHIIRGEDRREFNGLYEECYRKLGYPAPMHAYMPLLVGAGSAKISASEPYQVSTVLEKTTPDELFCFLVEQCIEQCAEGGRRVEPVRDRESAEARLLGDDWRAMLDGEPSAGQRFFARFATKPRVGIQEGRCVGQS